MGLTVAQKLIRSHLARNGRRAGDGAVPAPGADVELRIDQTLTQDATGTLVMLELEAMELDRVRTEVSAQYVDHNLLQTDAKNPDDHLFLESACRRFGVWYSRPGNGVSHPVHQERFGRPGRTLLGSDSHTCAAGAVGMLAIGTGGLDVALAMAGEPYVMRMPETWGVRLEGALEPGVSAKDVILEMLRRHGVDGGLGRVVEYHGPGLAGLSAMDRHVIANMGAELGATTTVFPADDAVGTFLADVGRADEFEPVEADADARYDHTDTIDLSALEPLVALPSSPGNVVPVREVAGEPIYQAYVGSSANPGFRDFAVAAAIVAGERVHDRVSFDVNPTSRRLLQQLVAGGQLTDLLAAGARLHQAGCNGCIGMGQAPATDRVSLRTVPRNFPGRSGTADDRVYLCSPETTAASALAGEITDPRERCSDLAPVTAPAAAPPVHVVPPPSAAEARAVELVKGPNVRALPPLEPLTEARELPIVLAVGHDVSTDEILPAGAEVLPLRSNVDAIARFAFRPIDPEYVERAAAARDEHGGHVIVGGRNYGQGSSREHAALAPRYLGLRCVVAESLARIHRRNLVNFGVLPLVFVDPADRDDLAPGERLRVPPAAEITAERRELELETTGGARLRVRHDLTAREIEVLHAGSRMAWAAQRLGGR